MTFTFDDVFESHLDFPEKSLYFFDLFLAATLICLAAVTLLFPFHFNLQTFLLWGILAWVGHRRKFFLKIKQTSYTLDLAHPIYLAAFFLHGLPFALWVFTASGAIQVILANKGIRRFGLEVGTTVLISTLIYSIPFFRSPINKTNLPQALLFILLFQALYVPFHAMMLRLFQGRRTNLKSFEKNSKETFDLLNIKEIIEELGFQPFLSSLVILISLWHELLILFFFLFVSDIIFSLEEQSRLGRGLEQTTQILNQALLTKDGTTERHTERVRRYAELIAKEMRLSPKEIEKIGWAAKLHDIGKLFIKDEVLKKASNLTQNEYEHIKLHVKLDNLLDPLFKIHNPLAEFIHVGRLHHERYDGQGYPFGLKASEIPLAARIISVADAWDAMTSNRPYRKPFEEKLALKILKQGAGTQWDPEVVFIFNHLYDSPEMMGIRNEYQDWKKTETKRTLQRFARLLAFET